MWHGVALSHRWTQSGPWPRQGQALGRRGCRDGSVAVAGGVLVLLLLPGIIDVVCFPATIRFVAVDRCPRGGGFPGIILIRCSIRFPRHIRPSRLILARNHIRAAGSERRFFRALCNSSGPNFLLYNGCFRRASQGLARRLSQGVPRSRARRSQCAAATRFVANGSGAATAQCGGWSRRVFRRRGAPTSLTPPPTSPASRSRAQ
jgi:hypothetical protein